MRGYGSVGPPRARASRWPGYGTSSRTRRAPAREGFTYSKRFFRASRQSGPRARGLHEDRRRGTARKGEDVETTGTAVGEPKVAPGGSDVVRLAHAGGSVYNSVVIEFSFRQRKGMRSQGSEARRAFLFALVVEWVVYRRTAEQITPAGNDQERHWT